MKPNESKFILVTVCVLMAIKLISLLGAGRNFSVSKAVLVSNYLAFVATEFPLRCQQEFKMPSEARQSLGLQIHPTTTCQLRGIMKFWIRKSNTFPSKIKVVRKCLWWEQVLFVPCLGRKQTVRCCYIITISFLQKHSILASLARKSAKCFLTPLN